MKKMRRLCAFVLFVLLTTAAFGGLCARAEGWTAIPQMDSSTARLPITGAVYALLRDTYGLSGPEPMRSKTHGAWLNLADGKADILFTVMPTEDELRYFRGKGVRIEVKKFGSDGLVFIGNESNPAGNLTADQIRAVYRGEIVNWAELGGGDAPIEAYIRNAESGSQRLFEELVWAGRPAPDFSALGFKEGEIERVASEAAFTLYSAMDAITYGVARNQNAIGYNIMSYVNEEYLSGREEEYAVRTTAEVNVRGGPGLRYPSLGVLSAESSMPYLEESAEDDRGVRWFKAMHGEKGEVWVSSRYSEVVPFEPVRIKLFSVDGFEPNTENFISGDYPFLTTSIVAIRADEPRESPARKLFDWVGSEESRLLIEGNSTLAVSFSEPYEYTGEEG